MEDSDFDEREGLLMGEVARRLEPRLPEILRAWTAAIPLVAPPDKIPGMRRTLVALTKEFVDSFFPALIAGGPQLALAAYIEFAERLMRRRPPATASNQRLTIADMMRAARVLRKVVDGEITLAFANEGADETAARLAFARLWNLASEAVAFSYSRLYEQQARLHQEELSVARDAALEASRLKSAFVADITHEIRTPLNVILGYADLMAERLADINDENALEFAEPIRRAGQRLLDTIGAVLDLSRIESGAFELRPATIKLADMVERQVKDLGVLARKKGIELVCQIDEPEATVFFDEHCLSNTIINLLQNAIKFTAKGSVTVRIYRDSNGTLALEVRDTGAGIDAAYLPRLFEPFSQASDGSAHRREGAGLGLALVKRYVEFNHAWIEVKSIRHAGTTFTVSFAQEGDNRAVD